MHRFAVAILVVLAALPVLAQTVTLPIDEYDKLRAPDHPENVTVVDTLLLGGSFKDRNLTVTFTGKSVGKRVATPVLQASSGVVIWGCSGTAVISRGEEAFQITPLADSFTATCKIAAPGSDRLELTGTRDVLAIASRVVDGELVAGGEPQAYSLVRQSAGGAENIPPTATGHYLITLLPDETRFRYAIDVHNPNRSRRPFEVRLRSGEHLQQVDAVAPYEVVDGAYRFDLPPGDSALVLTGQLGGETFTPPVDASLQYLAIENHPIVRPLIDGAVKRISAAEAGVPIQFRGPQAFLLGQGETMHWKKTKLEALHTVSYALGAAQHTFFVPVEGNVLGESRFTIDNQGASDVKLPLAPEPTYVSIENEALLMTKGPDGKLTVPLSAGKQQVLVQHRQSIRRLLGLGLGRLVVPQLGIPATSTTATINYPRQWVPLLQSFSTRTKFWSPSTEMMLLFLALLLWTERLLAWLGLTPKQRMTIALFVALASVSFDLILGLVAVGNAFLTIIWVMPYVKKERWGLLKAAVAVGIALALLVVTIPNLQKRQAPIPTSSSINSYDYARQQANVNGLVTTAAAPEAVKKSEPNYQGLPARFEIPGGDKQSSFSQELLTTDREQAVRVVLVSTTVIWLIGVAFVALAALGLWRSRQTLVAGVRARVTPAAVPEVQPAV